MTRIAIFGTMVWSLALLVGCSQYFYQPLRTSQARLGAETPAYKQLKSLPAAKEKIVAAVYKFRDQTGQYKPMEGGVSWSTAVTQGATSVLLRAMEESGWFIPIEREGLSNLFNERKIIKASRANYNNGKKGGQPVLPPLLFAGIILEGGIISFDSNVVTGGAGARYFGTGASTQYREDRVSIYLRAVSTTNGRILKTVYTAKTILSQKVDVGIFRFVSLKRLLEAETGFTYNEPAEMAVKEAIEKAVASLVIEGILEGLWQAEDTEVKSGPTVKAYLAEKQENQRTDIHGAHRRPRRGRIGLGLFGGGTFYAGDFSDARVFPAGHLDLAYRADRPLSFSLQMAYGKMGTADAYQGTIGSTRLGANYRFFNTTRVSPFATAGVGVVRQFSNNDFGNASSRLYPCLTGGLGIEQLVNDQFGIKAVLQYNQMFSDQIDGIRQGRYDDAFWQAGVGVSVYFR